MGNEKTIKERLTALEVKMKFLIWLVAIIAVQVIPAFLIWLGKNVIGNAIAK